MEDSEVEDVRVQQSCEQAKKRLVFFQNNVSIDETEVITEMLSYLTLYPSLAYLTGDVIATLAREVSFRDEAAKLKLPRSIVKYLLHDELQTSLQILRAIANLCIDHDVNREQFMEVNICEVLLNLVNDCCDNSKPEASNERYKLVVCGCLLNLSADNDKLTDSLVKCGALEKLPRLLLLEQPLIVKEMGLKALSVLCESGVISSVDNSTLADLLVKLASEPDEMDLPIELMETIIKKNDEKILLQLVNKGLVNCLLNTDGKHFQKMVDIAVLMLGNDSCMEKLYKEETVLSLTKAWLQSTTQKYMANGALIVANFARSDSNCEALIADGYVELILPLLKVEENKEYEGKLHFSALSALRNLSIPSNAKADLFSLGVVDGAILSLQTSSFPHVHFKALGILRLLAQKQSNVCLRIGEEALEDVISATKNTSTSHVHIEAGRLLATLTKYCNNKDIHVKVVACGGMESVYGLVQSPDSVLTGEGLLAMNIIAIISNDHTFSEVIKIITEDFINTICSKLSLKSSLDVLNNSLVLLSTLCTKESELKPSLLSSKELQEAVQELAIHENDTLRTKAQDVLSLLCV